VQQEHVSLDGNRRLAYLSWGNPQSSETVICVHGLTRNAHDFDVLSSTLCDKARIISIDVAGRGHSDWLEDPAAYNYPTYCSDAKLLCQALNIESAHWIGTSMGGLIGMFLAAENSGLIKSLVMNDVGPHIPLEALDRIKTYVGSDTTFMNIEAGVAYFQATLSGFGQLTDTQWNNLAVHSLVQENGTYRLNYDPRIANNFSSVSNDISLWDVWKEVNCPALVIRGSDSDLLTKETWHRMQTGKPLVELISFSNVGHAPALLDDEQIHAVERFIEEHFEKP